MTADENILGFLGLAARGRHIVSGEFMTEKAVRSHKARLVLIAGDASGNTNKKFTDTCTYHKVPYRIYGTRESIGHAIGTEQRAVIAVTDPGMAASLMKKIDTALTTESDN